MDPPILLSQEERNSIVDSALRGQFGSLWEREKPSLRDAIGPNDLEYVARFERALGDFQVAVKNDLEGLDDETLIGIRDYHPDPLEIEAVPWLKHLKTRPHRILAEFPPPIAYGFGHPAFQADFEHWLKMPWLNSHEALMLSVGAEPNSISVEDIKALEYQASGNGLWAAQEFLLKRLELFRRFFDCIEWGGGSVAIPQLKEWLDQTGLEVSPQFQAALSRRLGGDLKPRAEDGGKALDGQERETLLKLIAAMACEQYEFNLNSARNEAPKRIQEDLASVGLSMDPKTIRKWLREAAGLVSPDYWKDHG